MDVPLVGLRDEDPLVTRAKKDGGSDKVKNPIKEVAKFLKTYATAKIVVIVDTHSSDFGRFIWTGNSAETYLGCSLLEVR